MNRPCFSSCWLLSSLSVIYDLILNRVLEMFVYSSSYICSFFSSMPTSILFFSLLVVLPCFVDSVYFNFTSFQWCDPKNVIYHGDASPDGSAVLNNIGYAGRVGWVTYAEKVPISSSKTGKLTDFNTSFSFIINTRDASSGSFGHRFCFFLAPVGIQLLLFFFCLRVAKFLWAQLVVSWVFLTKFVILHLRFLWFTSSLTHTTT